MREMGKVLHLPQDVIERFSDLYANGDFPHTLQLDEQIRRAGLPQGHPRLPALIKLYHLAYGLPRHLGQHSGGMVLCTAGLDKIVPLEPASMPGRVVVQWDKDDCEDLGIIKVDLLGLGMMAAIEKTLEVSAADIASLQAFVAIAVGKTGGVLAFLGQVAVQATQRFTQTPVGTGATGKAVLG